MIENLVQRQLILYLYETILQDCVGEAKQIIK